MTVPGFDIILIKQGREPTLTSFGNFQYLSLYHIMFSAPGPYVKWPDLEGCSETIKKQWAALEKDIFSDDFGYKISSYYNMLCKYPYSVKKMNESPPINLLWPVGKDELVPRDSALWDLLQDAMVKFIDDTPRIKYELEKGEKMTETM